jgi:hypothetical protein
MLLVSEGVTMPIHDWTRVDAGLFHDFHQDWTVELRRTLNAGRLPPGFNALTDQRANGWIPDVLTLQRTPKTPVKPASAGGVAVAAAPPKARFVFEGEPDSYVRRANRIKIQHRHGEVVAVIEILSPGNKGSATALAAFIRKAADLIWNGVHLLVVDLFPPSDRDPQGIHKAIWDEVHVEPFELPTGTPLTVASYKANPIKTAYVEPVAVGSALPAIPLFLTDDLFIAAPLEESYQASWAAFPADYKDLLEPAPG